MARVIFVASGFALLAFTPPPAMADYHEAAWCAVLGMGKGVYWDCQYRTFEECRPNVLAGNRGWCNPNPYFVSDGMVTRQHYRKRHAHSQ